MIRIDTVEEAEEFFNKNLIMGFINEYSFDERVAMRSDNWFKSKYKVWHSSRIRQEDNIGSLMKLIDECEPESLDEWIEYYFTNFTTFTRFKSLVEQASISFGLSLKASLYYLWIHIIDFAWEGYSYEKQAKIRLEEQLPNLTFKKATILEDKEYGLDFTVWEGDKLIGAVQVKGFKYFVGKFAKERMMKHTSGYTAWERKTGTRIQYLIKETVFDNKELLLFPTYCFGDNEAPDYQKIVPSIIPTVNGRNVVKM